MAPQPSADPAFASGKLTASAGRDRPEWDRPELQNEADHLIKQLAAEDKRQQKNPRQHSLAPALDRLENACGNNLGRLLQSLHCSSLIKELDLGAESVNAALLAFTPLQKEEIERDFGSSVSRIVSGTRDVEATAASLSSAIDRDSAISNNHSERLQHLLLATGDIRSLLIALAHRISILRGEAPDDPQNIELGRETLAVHAPLANRMGLSQWKSQLEDFAFHLTNPQASAEIQALLEGGRSEREAYVQAFAREIEALLNADGLRGIKVSGRPKSVYSIWCKMQRKQLVFDALFDVRATRVLTGNVEGCYRALSIVHKHWPPITEEYDDYISRPKPNGYQSLHTTIRGPEGKTLEVQIRSHDMHRAAELGIAAHWQYKEKRNYDEDLDRSTRILRDLIERGQDEEAQSPLFSDRVFAFTPNDDIIELPRGATVLDFAYRIHSQIGNRCRGAKVNGAIVSLKYPVKNGDRIEILANKNATPSPAWMDRKEGYLKTSHALSRVRNWFNTRDLDGRLASGQQILDRELQRLEARDLSVEKLARKLNFNRLSEMLLALESGEVGPDRLANVVDQILRPQQFKPTPPTPAKTDETSSSDRRVRAQGIGHIQALFASCCKPVPPAAIVGYITRSQKISIHRQNCANLKRHLRSSSDQNQRFLDVEWDS